MTEETVSATTTIGASAETVFAVLADPAQHAAIDGTGWVRDSSDGQRLTGSGLLPARRVVASSVHTVILPLDYL